MFETKIIDAAHAQDINLKNEPFRLWGRMIPSYINETWGYTVCKSDPQDIREMCFPDENYDFGQMSQNSVFIGAYERDQCIGLAIMQDAFFEYMYLFDLKVSQAYRQMGVGAILIKKAKEIASSRGYHGIYTQGQDNNLSACLFYIKTGFRIGGLDTDVYKGSKQEGKADILFYLDI